MARTKNPETANKVQVSGSVNKDVMNAARDRAYGEGRITKTGEIIERALIAYAEQTGE